MIKKSRDPVEFYTNFLPKKTIELKKLNLLSIKSTKFFQDIGDNIRKSGSPIDNTIKQGKFFKLAEKINSIIKKNT